VDQPSEFWQRFEPAGSTASPPYHDRYPATMPDGRVLVLPLRQLPHAPDTAVASMISTQASFEVERAVVGWMAEPARPLEPEVVVGMPTLGLLYARALAERLGMANWVALGYSRKFWYDDALAEPVSSITSPGQDKRVYLDPRMLGRLDGRRVLLVDDVVSTGTSAVAAMRLLRKTNAKVVGMAFAMLQTERWRPRLAAEDPAWPALVRGVFATPSFERRADGWWPT
jgi:adenine/guanine phosphoribosyltransferase-like PRPP-binding protein